MRAGEREALEAVRHLDAAGLGVQAWALYRHAVAREIRPRLARSKAALEAYTRRLSALQAQQPPPPLDEEAARTFGREWALELQRISRAVPVDVRLDELSVDADATARRMDAETDGVWAALLERLAAMTREAA